MSSEILTIMLQNRKALKKIMDVMSTDQLNKIPSGFNNNIVWNVGHVIAVQQRLIYGLAGVHYSIDKEIVKTFLPGTSPDKYYDNVLIADIKQFLVTTYTQMITDINEDKFLTYAPFSTSLRYDIKDLSSALTFNFYHEALHMGHILNLMKFV